MRIVRDGEADRFPALEGLGCIKGHVGLPVVLDAFGLPAARDEAHGLVRYKIHTQAVINL